MIYLTYDTAIRAIACAMLTLFIVMAGATQSHAQNSDVTVAAFLGNPGQILTQNPDQLRTQVSKLATADPNTLSAIIGLMNNANKDQKNVIGKGLADAARNVLNTNQAYSIQIQTAVIRARDEEVRVAFTEALGDVRLGGTGGGPGGGGGGIGGPTNPQAGGSSSTGTPQYIGNAGTLTGLFTYSSSVSGLNNPTQPLGSRFNPSQSVSP